MNALINVLNNRKKVVLANDGRLLKKSFLVIHLQLSVMLSYVIIGLILKISLLEKFKIVK